MATQSPFSMFEGFLQNLPLPSFQPPAWAVDEAQRRIILLLNHILIQEQEATSRLARQKGRILQIHWRSFSLHLTATAAGLLDRASDAAKADLVLAVTQESPLVLVQTIFQGEKPAVRIEGDVQLAAEVNWLVDHVRWDVEEDLSQILGDVPAHMLGAAARNAMQALRQFVGKSQAAGPEQASS